MKEGKVGVKFEEKKLKSSNDTLKLLRKYDFAKLHFFDPSWAFYLTGKSSLTLW